MTVTTPFDPDALRRAASISGWDFVERTLKRQYAEGLITLDDFEHTITWVLGQRDQSAS